MLLTLAWEVSLRCSVLWWRLFRGLERPRRIDSNTRSSGGGGRFSSLNDQALWRGPRFQGARATTWQNVTPLCQRRVRNWITTMKPYIARKERPSTLVSRTVKCSCRISAVRSIIQMMLAMANTTITPSRRSSSFSFSSSTAPNMADSGTRQACRKPERTHWMITKKTLHLFVENFKIRENNNRIIAFTRPGAATLTKK